MHLPKRQGEVKVADSQKFVVCPAFSSWHSENPEGASVINESMRIRPQIGCDLAEAGQSYHAIPGLRSGGRPTGGLRTVGLRRQDDWFTWSLLMSLVQDRKIGFASGGKKRSIQYFRLK
jgi:hypothetical protein